MTIAIDQPPPPHVKRWTKREYNELIEMSPQYHPHAFAVTRLTKALVLSFEAEGGHEIRIQLPFETPGESMPEPDALVCTIEQNLRLPHPNQAILAIEVADSSLATDREKAFDYAAAGIPEYWIVDVNRRVVEVYRNPVSDATAFLGFRYGQPTIYNADASIETLAKPGVKIQISQLFHQAS